MPGHLDVCWQDPVPRGARHWSPTARRRIGLSPYGDGIAEARVASAIAERIEAFIMNDLTEGIAVFYCSSIWNCSRWPSLRSWNQNQNSIDIGCLYTSLLVLSPFGLVTSRTRNLFLHFEVRVVAKNHKFRPIVQLPAGEARCAPSTRCTLGVLRDLPQTSALIVRLKFGKTKGLLMFVVPIVGRSDYDSYLLLCSAALRPCLLSGGISNSRLAARACHWWCSWAHRVTA